MPQPRPARGLRAQRDPGAARAFVIAFVALLLLSGCSPAFHRGALPGEPKDARYAQVGDTRVRYVDEGQGPAVVLLHGFASSLDNWKRVRPALRQRHRVIALDLKGFGWSDRPPGDYSPRAQAHLVRALLDQRGVDDVAVVGHSWGGSVAMQLALNDAKRVRRVALYDAWVFEEQLPTAFHMARAPGLGELIFGAFYDERIDEKMASAFFDRRYVTEAFVEEVERGLERPGSTAAALAAARSQHFDQVQQRYSKMDKPTLLMWGREDRITPLHYGERLARTLPGARLVVYPRCGHFPMIEAAAESTRELSAFLSEDLAGAGTRAGRESANSSTSTRSSSREAPGSSASTSTGTSSREAPGSSTKGAQGTETKSPVPAGKSAPPRATDPAGVDDAPSAPPNKLSPNPFDDGGGK
ncbi:MAG TPA: alpha/beta fold hydrolase [Polyangiaceae bacterium]|nr:alpha/beta fold hydrolase [Polyangiaceae bacterium]